MKAINKAMDGRFWYKEVELKWVLQQLHRHRRETWMISFNPEKVKAEKKRKGTNSRRGDMSINICNFSILLVKFHCFHLFYLYYNRKKIDDEKAYLTCLIMMILCLKNLNHPI